MKYCSECKAYAWDGIDNCPVCGSHLEKADKELEFYKRQNEVTSRPKVKYRSESAFLKKKSFILILSITAISVFVNAIITPWLLWSALVAVAGFATYFGVLAPIFNRRKLYAILSINAFVAPLSVFLVDAILSLDRVGNLSKASFALPYAVPGILIGIIIAIDVMAMARKSKLRYYTIALFHASLYALIPQVAQWIFNPITPGWLTFSCFAFAIANLAIMTIVYWTKTKAEWRRKMHL